MENCLRSDESFILLAASLDKSGRRLSRTISALVGRLSIMHSKRPAYH